MAFDIAGILQVLRIIIAITLIFFLPGYFLTSILFRKKQSISNYEKIALSICLSISINIVCGIILASLNQFSEFNLWAGMVSISLLLYAAYMKMAHPQSKRIS